MSEEVSLSPSAPGADDLPLVGARDGFEPCGEGRVWQVVQGMVDIFLQDRRDQPDGERHHLLRVAAGGVVFAAGGAPGAVVGLWAVPGNNTRLRPRDLGLLAAEDPTVTAAALDHWVAALADAIAGATPPVAVRAVGAGLVAAGDDGLLAIAQDQPLVIDQPPPGLTVADRAETVAAGPLVLSRRLWVGLPAGAELRLHPATDWLEGDGAGGGLAAFTALALGLAGDRLRAARRAELDHLAQAGHRRAQALAGTVDALVRTIEDRRAHESRSLHPVMAACELVAAELGVGLVAPPGGPDALDAAAHPVEMIARASRLQARHVALGGRWWRRQAGPLVGHWADGGACALLPTLTGYRVVDPGRGLDAKVTARLAAMMAPDATQLCAPLPDGPVGAWALLGFCLKGSGLDWAVITLMVLLAGALSLLPPLATKEVFDSVIPANQVDEAMVLGAGLMLAGVSAALFRLVQGIGLLRIEGRLDLRLQVALWDRVVRAPAGFFRDYSSGDLVSRLQTLDTVRKLLTGSVINSVIGGAMGTFSLGLMVYYAPLLSLIMAALTLAVVLVGFLLGWRLVALDRQSLMLGGRIQAMVVQLLGALEKFRVTATEDIAFARWARQFRAARVVANKNGHAYVAMLALMGSFAPLALAVVFITLGLQSGELFSYFSIPTSWEQITGQPLLAVMPTSDFVAFISAYVQFLTAMTGLMTVCIRLSSVPPLIGRLKPIFQTPTEHWGAHDPPGDLVGRIEFKDVTFRYGAGGAPVLDGLSLSIEPGQFVALVGPSGSGKSSAIRLLLGFETPQAGSIFVDGRDLARLDKGLLREQMGVVVQDGRLIPGTILDNLTGGIEVGREAVWQAARDAGFAADLERMPQGLDTPITDGAGNISGGQRQRLLIARALLRKPRLLVLDEATSALDNETQDIVSRAIAAMGITRIAVAHRLSTIRHADRIFVIAAGRVVEQGGYDELIARGGPFADLVRRQAE